MTRLLAGLMFALAATSFARAAEPLTIRYELPAPAQVSAAIYDARGRQIRTVASAVPQTAGPQTMTWDGLDREGRPATAGRYDWKLVHGPGIKAEYLLALGTSVGIDHWIGQHGGPNTVAVDPQGIIVGGHPEGAPLLCKVQFDGKYGWGISQQEAAQGTADIATADGKVYVLMDNGHLYTFDGATGKRAAKMIPLRMKGPSLGGVPLTADERQKLEFDVPNGAYLLRVTTGGADEFSVPLALSLEKRQAEAPAADLGKTASAVVPEVFRHPSAFQVTDGKLTIGVTAKSPGKWAIASLDLIATATRLVARDGAVVALFPGANVAAWIDPATGKVEDQVDLTAWLAEQPSPKPALADIDLANASTLYVLAGKSVLKAERGKPGVSLTVEGLHAPNRLSVDPMTGDVLVSERGKEHQVKRYSAAGQLLASYGRAGGRRTGLYQGEDFHAVADLAADGQGGFVVVEAESAPRRTARFDRMGKLVREWFGGQQFYTFAAPEPDNPNRVWMDSQWGWLMQVEVDYDQRTWKVRACYPWAELLDGWWADHGKMARHMVPLQVDRDGDGRKETYLWSDAHRGLLLQVDETQGKLLPIALLGNNRGNDEAARALTPEQLPAAWREALEAAQPGLSASAERRMWSGFGWADANGDHRMQGNELRLFSPAAHKSGHGFGGGSGCMWLDDQFRIYNFQATNAANNGPTFSVREPTGRTATGAPIWDWAAGITARAPAAKAPAAGAADAPWPQRFGGSRALRVGPDGSVYQVLEGGGEGFHGGLDSSHGHGFGWPATLADRTAFVKYSPQGEPLWQVGAHAARTGDLRGTTQNPTWVTGFARGCVGLADYAVQPCNFWTEDGLYVGELLDGRVEDGLPARIYSWWRADRRRGDEFSNLAAFQYDLLVGGSLVERANGEVLFMGAGWNNVPVYRVHGLDQLQRLAGTLEVTSPATAALAKGTGLRGETFARLEDLTAPAKASVDVEIDALLEAVDKKPSTLDEAAPSRKAGVRTDPQIWFEPGKANRGWPEGAPAAARWTGELEPRFSEPYVLSVYALGGCRLWVGGKLVIDRWDDGGKHFSPPIPCVVGQKVPIKLEWRALKGDREAHLCWQSATQGIEHVPATALYGTAAAKP